MAAAQPVAVTRWTARLADPEHERTFRLQRFPDDRRRLFIVMSLVGYVILFSLRFRLVPSLILTAVSLVLMVAAVAFLVG